MKQVGDKMTKEIFEAVDRAEPARRRGRPSKPDALTGAERAQRFRDAHRNDPPAVTVKITEKDYKDLKRSAESLSRSLVSAYGEITRYIQTIAAMEEEIKALKARRKPAAKK